MDGLLDGLKVVDLSSVLAGPMTGSFLAECGADVLKVEAPTGDVTQTWRVAGEPKDRTSAYHAAANTGKRFTKCNLKTSEGRDWLAATLADADVLIQNMKWQDLALMDLLPHDLQARFPRLVHVRLACGSSRHAPCRCLARTRRDRTDRSYRRRRRLVVQVRRNAPRSAREESEDRTLEASKSP